MNLRAFTTLEIVIAIGVIFIFMSASFIFLGSSPNIDVALKDEAYKIETSLKNARYRALIGEEEKDWGVYFSNLTNRKPFYSLFKGTSWQETSSVWKKNLENVLIFNIPTSNSSTTILFERLSGNLKNATSAVIEIVVKTNPTLGRRITVNQLGGVKVESIGE